MNVSGDIEQRRTNCVFNKQCIYSIYIYIVYKIYYIIYIIYTVYDPVHEYNHTL